MPIGRPPATLQDVFDRLRIEPNGCWSYNGIVDMSHRANPYPRVYVNGKQQPVMHLTYQASGKPTREEGTPLDHSCRNTWCVNPDHLENVSHSENVLRGVGYAATNARKEFCKHGHEFTEANTYYLKPDATYKRGRRQCRECKRIAKQRQKEVIANGS